MQRYIRLVIPMVVVLAIGACARSTENADATFEPAASEVRVTVRNEAFWDATIYLLRGGSRQRIGTVSGASTQTFVLPRQSIAGLSEVRFGVDWIGRRDDAASQSILAQPGDHIELVIR